MCEETLCWTCKYATSTTLPTKTQTNPQNQNNPQNSQRGSASRETKTEFYRCPWATEFEPVENWSATPQKLKISPDQTIDSYIVHSCPYYRPDLEAMINSLTDEEIAKRLGVSTNFESKHKKVCRELLYFYIRRRTADKERAAAKLTKSAQNTQNNQRNEQNEQTDKADRIYQIFKEKEQYVKEYIVYAEEDYIETVKDKEEEIRKTGKSTISDEEISSLHQKASGARSALRIMKGLIKSYALKNNRPDIAEKIKK